MQQIQDKKCLQHNGPALPVKPAPFVPGNDGTTRIDIPVYYSQQRVEQKPASKDLQMYIGIKGSAAHAHKK